MIYTSFGQTYQHSSFVSWKYLSGILLFPLMYVPFVDTFTLIQQNEYLLTPTMSSLVASGALVIIYTEIILFCSVFARMSYGDNTYIINASSFLVIGIIIILSCSCIANSLFATLLCKELVTTTLTKLFFNITGLHFVHVIIGYFLLLHCGDAPMNSFTYGDGVIVATLTQLETSFTSLYWHLVEGLWLVIDSLVFCLFS